jgi:ketosteroid isomerase-like protein
VSTENTEVVRRAFEAYVAGDVPGAMAYFADDVVADFTIRVDASVGHGHDGLLEIVTTWVDTWDDYTEQLDEVRDLGGPVMVVLTQGGRAKQTGLEIYTQYAGLCELEDGLITKLTMYENPAKAMAAAGA